MAALAGAAWADWSDTATLATPDVNSVWPSAAMNAHGDAAVSWLSSNHHRTIDVSIRPAGGAFGPAVTVSKAHEIANAPSVAIDPDGDVVVVFSAGHHDNPPEENGVKASFVSADGDVVGPLKIGRSLTGTVGATGLGMDAAGNAIAWWDSVDERQLRFAVRPADGSFGEPKPIPNPAGDLKRLDFAVGGNGEAVAAWTTRTELWAAIGGVDGEFAPATRLNGPIQSVMQPRVAVAPDGSAIVAWVDRPDERGSGFVRVAYRPAGGAFGPAQTVAEVFYTGVYDVSVAMGPDGEALVAWSGATWVPRTEWHTTFVTRPPGGTFGAPREGMRAWCHDPPRVAYDSAGNTYAACRHYYGYSLTQPLAVAYAAARPAGADWFGPVKQLTPEGLNVWEPALAAGGPGQAVAAWPRGWFPDWFGLEFATHSGTAFAPPAVAPPTPPSRTAEPGRGDPRTGEVRRLPTTGGAQRAMLDDVLGRLRRAKHLLRRLRRGSIRLRMAMPGAGAFGVRVVASPSMRLLARGRVVTDRAGPVTLTLRATSAGRRQAARRRQSRVLLGANLRLAGQQRIEARMSAP